MIDPSRLERMFGPAKPRATHVFTCQSCKHGLALLEPVNPDCWIIWFGATRITSRHVDGGRFICECPSCGKSREITLPLAADESLRVRVESDERS